MCGPAPERAGDVRPGLDGEALSRALYVLGAQTVSDRLRLAEARGEGDAEADLRTAAAWRAPDLPINGRDLIKAGLQTGPHLGAILSQLEEAWIESGFTLDRQALLAMASEGRG
jgi:poly(A) polymerase